MKDKGESAKQKSRATHRNHNEEEEVMDSEETSDPTYCGGMSGELDIIRMEMKYMRKQLK